jgi:hypothetical protein
MEFRRYLIICGITFLFLLVLTGGINLLVDPDGRLRIVDIEGFNQIKFSPKRDSRQGKAVALEQCDYDVIILGSSTAEIGLSPSSAEFGGKAAFNAALKSSSTYELYRMAQFTALLNDPEAVVIGLDFYAFNQGQTFADDYEQSVLAETADGWGLARYALSIKTLRAAVVTVNWNIRDIAKGCAHNGQQTVVQSYAGAKGSRGAFDFIQERYMSNPTTYGNYRLGTKNLREFEEVLRLYVNRGTHVYLFVSPVHAALLTLIKELGLEPQYGEWQRELVRIVARVNAELRPAEPLVLWDFSGYSGIATEAVPDGGEGTAMEGWRDPPHYKPHIGDMILARILGTESARAIPPDFGIRLTPDNIEAVLAERSAAALRYEQTDPMEVANTRRLVAEYRNNGDADLSSEPE